MFQTPVHCFFPDILQRDFKAQNMVQVIEGKII